MLAGGCGNAVGGSGSRGAQTVARTQLSANYGMKALSRREGSLWSPYTGDWSAEGLPHTSQVTHSLEVVAEK